MSYLVCLFRLLQTLCIKVVVFLVFVLINTYVYTERERRSYWYSYYIYWIYNSSCLIHQTGYVWTSCRSPIGPWREVRTTNPHHGRIPKSCNDHHMVLGSRWYNNIHMQYAIICQTVQSHLCLTPHVGCWASRGPMYTSFPMQLQSPTQPRTPCNSLHICTLLMLG